MENNEGFLFSESDFDVLRSEGMSEEDISILRRAQDIAETMEMLPDDIDELIEKWKKIMSDSMATETKNFLSLAVNDQNLLIQLVALIELARPDSSLEISKDVVIDPALANLTDEEAEKAQDAFFSLIGSLSAKDRAEFFALLKNITHEQKVDMVRRLLK